MRTRLLASLNGLIYPLPRAFATGQAFGINQQKAALLPAHQELEPFSYWAWNSELSSCKST